MRIESVQSASERFDKCVLREVRVHDVLDEGDDRNVRADVDAGERAWLAKPANSSIPVGSAKKNLRPTRRECLERTFAQ